MQQAQQPIQPGVYKIARCEVLAPREPIPEGVSLHDHLQRVGLVGIVDGRFKIHADTLTDYHALLKGIERMGFPATEPATAVFNATPPKGVDPEDHALSLAWTVARLRAASGYGPDETIIYADPGVSTMIELHPEFEPTPDDPCDGVYLGMPIVYTESLQVPDVDLVLTAITPAMQEDKVSAWLKVVMG